MSDAEGTLSPKRSCPTVGGQTDVVAIDRREPSVRLYHRRECVPPDRIRAVVIANPHDVVTPSRPTAVEPCEALPAVGTPPAV